MAHLFSISALWGRLDIDINRRDASPTVCIRLFLCAGRLFRLFLSALDCFVGKPLLASLAGKCTWQHTVCSVWLATLLHRTAFYHRQFATRSIRQTFFTNVFAIRACHVSVFFIWQVHIAVQILHMGCLGLTSPSLWAWDCAGPGFVPGIKWY